MITVNGLNITDNLNYLVEEVTYKSTPVRNILSVDISRRPGMKLTATEWSNKEINIKGRVFSTTVSGLLGLVDTLQQNFAVQSLALSIDTNRTYTATLESMDIPTQFYNNTMVQYDAKFLCVDPFAYANQITASGTVVSGTVTLSGAITISGSVFSMPQLSIYPKGANSGNSGIKAVTVTYVPTSETMTVSGTFNYSSPVTIDYFNFLVTNSGIASDYTGIFSRWDVGVDNFTITVSSGVKQAFNYVFSYQPRYFQ